MADAVRGRRRAAPTSAQGRAIRGRGCRVIGATAEMDDICYAKRRDG